MNLLPRRVVLAVMVLLCLAPTPGDVGGCGQPVEDLDPSAFFDAKRDVDCDACQECAFANERCRRICSEETLDEDFPRGCFPLVHDGRVCLRALRHTSCEEYERFISDVSPSAPTECNFCPAEER